MEGGGGLLELLFAALGQVALHPSPLTDPVRLHVGASLQLLVHVVLVGVEVGADLARRFYESRHIELLGVSMWKDDGKIRSCHWTTSFESYESFRHILKIYNRDTQTLNLRPSSDSEREAPCS